MATAGVAAIRTRVAMVSPHRAAILVPVADLRATPDEAAELVDQAHYLENVRVLGARGGWTYVQTQDHYFGWVQPGTILDGSTDHGDARVVAVPLAPVHRERDEASDVVGQLPVGTPMPQYSSAEDLAGWARVHVAHAERTLPRTLIGYVSLDDTVLVNELPQRPPTYDDLIATADAFLGVPYLWGGTTALGIDCSGYAQQVYRLNGIRLDRDAHQQAMEGRAVDVPAPGDLIFFGEQGVVTHVALATGERTFLNAPERGRKVERGELGEGRTVLGVRRYLP